MKINGKFEKISSVLREVQYIARYEASEILYKETL